MKVITAGSALALLAGTLALTACGESQAPDGGASELDDSAAAHMSYGAGYALGGSVRDQLEDDFDKAGFLAGVEDALAERDMRVSEDQLAAARDDIVGRRDEGVRQRAEAELETARAFLAENAQREAVTVTDSGLQYEVLESGDGNQPGRADEVVAHYTGQLADGTVFDSSEARGEPARFPLDRVIAGWQEALQLMREGDRWRIWLPPELGYGEQGAGDAIPPNAALMFEVELIEVVR